MSLNQITQSNTYLPPVHFYESKIDNAEITNLLMPVSFQNNFSQTPAYKASFFVDSGNTALKLQGRQFGAGCYIQLESPIGDQDMRLAVSPLGDCLLSCKQDLSFTDENFTPSIQLNKNLGGGLKIFNGEPNYSASDFNAYMTSTYNGVLSGFTSPVNCQVVATRIGNMVFLTVDAVNSTTAGGVITFTSNILAEPFRPSIAVDCNIPNTVQNSVNWNGVCEVLPSGNLSFEYTPGVLFTANPNSGWGRFCCSYTIV